MAELKRHQIPEAFKTNWLAVAGWVIFAFYIFYVLSTFDFSAERLEKGLKEFNKITDRVLPPELGISDQMGLYKNLLVDKYDLLLEGLIESIQIAIIATVLGVILSLPIGLMGATNLMPPWLTWPSRALVALCRSFHPVIMAIIFVKAVGFGASAGILTLILFSIGFIAKLFTEAIEEISLKQIEAIRATGAPFMSVIIFAVMPQVMSRFIGFSSYQLDANLRNSTMVGIVGAGGIGGTLFAAFQRFDYMFLVVILLSIIALIMVSEVVSAKLRKTFQ